MTIHPVALLILVLSPLLVSCTDDIAYYSTNGHYYQLVMLSSPITNDQAKTLASSKSHLKQTGYIVTLGDANEAAFLMGYIGALNVSSGSSDWPTIWTGAYESGTTWTWNAAGRISNTFYDAKSATCYSYCNWYSTLVSSFGSALTCAQIFLNNANGPTPGTWRAASCSSTSQALVIEYDASTSCAAGYVYRTSKGWCEDVNECTNNPTICGSGYQCVNTIGSYECDDINECALNATICGSGYQCANTNGSYVCNDINECLQTPSVCSSGYTCQNTPGSYSCQDINECIANSSLCAKGYVCENTPGSYQCNDINECLIPGTCPFGTKCANTIGSYTCDSLYYQIISVYNGLALDYYYAADGINRIITAPSNTSSVSQLWSFTPDNFILNANNGYAMDAEGGNVYPNVNVILWPRKRSGQANNQLWEYDMTSQLWSSLYYDVVLDIFHAQYAPGAPICLFPPKTTGDTPSGNINQRWSLVESSIKP